MYTVWLANFNTVVYEGSDKSVAMATAIRTGRQCLISFENKLLVLDPSCGWHYIY